MSAIDRFLQDVAELQRRTAMSSFVSSSDSSTTVKPQARWELASTNHHKTRVVVLSRLDSRDGFALHCRVPPIYGEEEENEGEEEEGEGFVVYHYRSKTRDPFDHIAREKRRREQQAHARERQRQKELHGAKGKGGKQSLSRKPNVVTTESATASGGNKFDWEGSRHREESVFSSDDYSSESDEQTDTTDDEEDFFTPPPISRALKGRFYDHVDELLGYFYQGKAFSEKVMKGYPPTLSPVVGQASNALDPSALIPSSLSPPRADSAANFARPIPTTLTGTKRAGSPKPPLPRRPQPTTAPTNVASSSPLAASPSTHPPESATWLPSLDTEVFDYSHVYKDAAPIVPRRPGGKTSAKTAAARSEVSVADEVDDTFVSPLAKSRSRQQPTKLGDEHSPTNDSVHSNVRGNNFTVAKSLNATARRHLKELESLCAFVTTASSGGISGHETDRASNNDVASFSSHSSPSPSSSPIVLRNGKNPAAVVSLDSEKQVFIVDIAVSLAFMPPLRCRAIGLENENLLVARVLFPATGSGKSYWSGGEEVKIQKVFMCHPKHFGTVDADTRRDAEAEKSEESDSAAGSKTLSAANQAAPVPWYMRNRLQDIVTRNQMALQKIEVIEKSLRVEALGYGANASPPHGRTASMADQSQYRITSKALADIDLLFRSEEERFFGAKTSVLNEESSLSSAGPTNAQSNQDTYVRLVSLYYNGNGGRDSVASASSASLIECFQRCILCLLANCTSVCLVCDDPLGFAGSKVGICAKDLCQHTSQRFGINTDIIAELTKSGEVCELLLNLTRLAATTGSTRDTFEPMCPVHINHQPIQASFPSSSPSHERFGTPVASFDKSFATTSTPSSLPVAAHNRTHFYVDNFGSSAKDFDLLCSTIDAIPPVDDLVRNSMGSSQRLKEYLQRTAGPLAFPLLQWIISSNHAHLEPVPSEHKIQGLGTEHQFYLISNNPEKERLFREAKRRAQKANPDGEGSFYAWHGSGAGNWHCILRLGLRNYSGTRLMSTGQIYGSGVYFAKSLVTSLPYMGQPQKGWINSKRIEWQRGATKKQRAEADATAAAALGGGEKLAAKEGILVISLCEVVKASTGWKDHENNIITVQDENLISTRFLFVYPDGQPDLTRGATQPSQIIIPKGIFNTD